MIYTLWQSNMAMKGGLNRKIPYAQFENPAGYTRNTEIFVEHMAHQDETGHHGSPWVTR